MPRKNIIFREAPRFLPIRQQELRVATRPISRCCLLYGPILSLLGLGVVMRFAPQELGATLILNLFLAPFALLLVFNLPLWLSHVPRFGASFLTSWRLTRHGLLIQGGYDGRGIPWSRIQSLHIAEGFEEITLQLVAVHQGAPFSQCLTCRRADTVPESLEIFSEAVRNKKIR